MNQLIIFSEIPALRPKYIWKLPKGHASLEVFLSRVEKDLFVDKMNILCKVIFLEKNGRP